MTKQKRSKNQIRREKAKLRKTDISTEKNPVEESANQVPKGTNREPEDIVVPSQIEIETDPLFTQFQSVFNKFKGTTDQKIDSKTERGEVLNEIDDDEDDVSNDSEGEEEKEVLSKKQLRMKNKVPLATLKASTTRPQVVEWYDVDAQDPYLLVNIKSQPNVIQVPGHWSSKREYLSSRRGVEKPPFQLPNFIRDTGIQDMRNNDDLTLKQQQRERVQPRMGRLDIDYQKLHDAFFKFQSKPRLFGYGDIYFEGREGMDEYGDDIVKLKPGYVSKHLRNALGMQENDLAAAPPWLDIMINIGKPPAYENLLIPGLDMEYTNDGYKSASFQDEFDIPNNKVLVDAHWGRLDNIEESSEDEANEDEEEEEEEEEHGHGDEQGYGLSEEAEKTRSHEDENMKTDYDAQKIAISEFGGIKKRENKSLEPENTDAKQLYTIIKESKPKFNDEMLGTEFGYEIANSPKHIKQVQDEAAYPEEGKRKDFRF